MSLFIVTFIVMGLAVFGMAVGVIAGRNPIKGSCGGLNTIPGIECACSEPCEKRKQTLALGRAEK
jgi:hypothetical protein